MASLVWWNLMPRKEVNHGLHQKALFGRSSQIVWCIIASTVTNLSYQIDIYSGWQSCPILVQAKCWHEAKYSVVLFWRNEKLPHWDGICDSVGCPVHNSVLADEAEFFFSSSTGSGLKMACLHNISRAIYHSETVCLSFFVPCVFVMRYWHLLHKENLLVGNSMWKKQLIQETPKNPVKCQCFHRFLLVMASFSISWLHGFQVLQVSSPHCHLLGRAWEPGVRCVGGQLDCHIGRKVRAPRWVVWCRFSIGFRKSRFGLGSVDDKRQTWVGIISQYKADFIRFIDGQTITSRNFHISHPSFKPFKMLLVVLLLDSSKVCPAPKRLRWATVLPQQLLASLGALHVRAMDSACSGFTILHHRPLVQMKGESKLQSIRKPTAFHSTHTRYKS